MLPRDNLKLHRSHSDVVVGTVISFAAPVTLISPVTYISLKRHMQGTASRKVSDERSRVRMEQLGTLVYPNIPKCLSSSGNCNP